MAGFSVYKKDAERVLIRFGRSGETRTRGLMVPNHARYQLRYASIYVERETGIEPATFSLGSYCSTIEPFPQVSIFYHYFRRLSNLLRYFSVGM